MKSFKGPHKVKQYWKKLMDSTRNKMSKGAQKISRMISWAKKDNWRRSDRKNRK